MRVVVSFDFVGPRLVKRRVPTGHPRDCSAIQEEDITCRTRMSRVIENRKREWVSRPRHERGDEHDGAQLAESRPDEGHGVHFFSSFRQQNGVRRRGSQNQPGEHGVSMLEGEVHHDLVQGDDDLHGEDVEGAVASHQEQQQARVHCLVDDGDHEVSGVEADAGRGVHECGVSMRRLHRLPQERIDDEANEHFELDPSVHHAFGQGRLLYYTLTHFPLLCYT